MRICRLRRTIPREARILPRFARAMERLADAEKLGRVLLETDAEAHPDPNGRVLRRSADGHDPARLRGLPAVGRNVTSAIFGTNPEAELLRRESRGELRL